MTKNLLKNTIDKGGEVSPFAANSSSSPSAPPAGFSAPPLEELPTGWRILTVNEIAQKTTIGPFGSRMKSETYTKSGVPVIRGTNLSNGKLLSGDWVYISEEFADELSNCVVTEDDLVFPHRGSIGEVGVVPPNPDRYVISSSLMMLRCDKTKALSDYLYYFFKSSKGKFELLKNASQVGTPGIGQPLSSLRNIEIPLPPLSEQYKISQILSSLDNKLALNSATNQTLEEIAKALFKSWFVDFDPVYAKTRGEHPVGMDDATAALFPDTFQESELGLIPTGWEVKSLDTIADYLNGLALQKYPVVEGKPSLPVIKIAELKKGNSLDADRANNEVPEEYIIDDGDVVFSWSGSLYVDIWCGGKGALNQHLFKVSSNTIPKWLYFLWTKNHLQSFQQIATDKAVTMGHIKRSHLTEAKCCIPPSSVIGKISPKFKSLLDEQMLLRLESTKLAELRDTLLPKLLSGEISVKNIPNIDLGV